MVVCSHILFKRVPRSVKPFNSCTVAPEPRHSPPAARRSTGAPWGGLELSFWRYGQATGGQQGWCGYMAGEKYPKEQPAGEHGCLRGHQEMGHSRKGPKGGGEDVAWAKHTGAFPP